MQRPIETVLEQFEFFDSLGRPLIFKEKQVEAINDLAPLARAGLYAEVATGKTAMSTACALYKAMVQSERVYMIVLMPPILIPQWFRWLQLGVRHKETGLPPCAVMYRGTPRQRKQLDLDQDFILMSIQVFKKDFEYLSEWAKGKHVFLLPDEATSIKNPESDNYKMTRDFTDSEPDSRELMLLTGTPLSKPGDAYAYVKLVSPTVYRNHRHFEQVHVSKKDFFGKVTHWDNLEFLRENLLLNSKRILQKEIWPDLDDPLYDPIHYDLEPEHIALYNKLAEEQILLIEDGGKIDATVKQRLYAMLQQIICNPGHFSGKAELRSAAHELLDQILDELSAGQAEGRKLMIYATYQMTNRGLLQYLEPYGFVGFYGEISGARQQENLQRLVHDPKCWGGVAQPLSAGYGLDGLQAVISDCFFMETPTVGKDFAQAVGRFTRPGQTRKVNVRIGIANGTCQHRLHRQLLDNDALANSVQGGWQDLKDAIYGVS